MQRFWECTCTFVLYRRYHHSCKSYEAMMTLIEKWVKTTSGLELILLESYRNTETPIDLILAFRVCCELQLSTRVKIFIEFIWESKQIMRSIYREFFWKPFIKCRIQNVYMKASKKFHCFLHINKINDFMLRNSDAGNSFDIRTINHVMKKQRINVSNTEKTVFTKQQWKHSKFIRSRGAQCLIYHFLNSCKRKI